MRKPRLLVACEFSWRVREAFAKRGWDAWSCDLLPTEIPGQHIQDDVLKHLTDGWDLMIAHPPCTYLCNGGQANMTRRPYLEWERHRGEALEFVMRLKDAPIEHIAIENPSGWLSSQWRKPDQLIRPSFFGEPYRKDVCLWLKNLPKLNPTTVLFPPKPWKKLDFWSDKRLDDIGRSRKSITFQGIADAMATQWGDFVLQAIANSEVKG